MGEWTSCDDRLPENSGIYIIAYDNNFFFNTVKKDIVYTVAAFDAEYGRWNIKLACPIIAWAKFQGLSEDGKWR
ncbi:MAG: DUF551 domain-containing protein [Ruminococcus sp.]|nr:DUF551 domain-containing protein [Ruminococcus sp.]